jgi:chemotaxis protein CheC
MTVSLALSPGEMTRLQTLAGEAVHQVSRGLTEMFSASVAVTAMHISVRPLNDVVQLLGDPELEAISVYLAAEGDIPGHLLLLLPVPVAYELCDILLEQPTGTTEDLGDLELSALGEVGNIVGSFFLNSLADSVGLCLHVTPPGVIQDMAGAAVDVALAEVAMYADEAVVIDANFEHRGRRLPAWFLAFPEPESLRRALTQGAPA